MMTIKSWIASLLAVCAVASVAIAHDDDGKIRDRQKPYRGPGWREVDGKKNDGSVAGSFDSNGIQLRSWLPLASLSAASTSGSSCWGYISPAGREYGIIGTSDGTAFVEITNPGAAALKAFITGPTSLWRDVRVYGQYCYAASEGGSGIQVMDMTQLDATNTVTLVNTILAPTTTTAASHTLAIDTVSGYLYRAGGGANGLRIYDIHTNPAVPTYVGAWSPIYVHECQVVTYTTGPYAGKQIAFCCGGSNSGNVNSGLYVVDVTNKAAPVQLSYTTYPGAKFCHQGWLDADSRYFYINDELDEGATVTVTTTIVMDCTSLTAPIFVGTFNNGNTAIGHNCFVKGTKLYEANYRSGFRVFDLSVSKTNPPESAYFDTYPGSDSAQFNGLWNVWPFFPSGNVIGSDLERGFFVWTVAPPLATFAVAAPPAYSLPAGGTTVAATITPAAGQTMDTGSGTMTVTWGTNSVTSALVSLGNNQYRGTFPAVPCGTTLSYKFGISNTLGQPAIDTTSRSALSAVGEAVIASTEFEAADGWVGSVVGDTAVSGQWVRADPVGTSAQPEDDHSPVGTICWITGNGPVGGAVGTADIDGGTTTLLSPAFNLVGLDNPTIECWYWYSNNQGAAPGLDTMPVEISADNGTTWVQMALISTNNPSWTKATWRVRDYITPTATVRVRFVARDLDAGSVVEAGVDDFKITNVDCIPDIVGDLNADGIVNASDLSILLNAWGGVGPADLNGDGHVDATDLAIMMNGWTG